MMRRFGLPLALSAAALLAAGCAARLAPLGTPPAVLTLDPDHALAASSLGTLEVVLSWPLAPGRQTQDFPLSTTAFRLTVTGADFAPAITATVTRPSMAATSSVRLQVPAGAERALMAEALNATGRVMASGATSSLTVTPGAFTPVDLVLTSRVGSLEGTLQMFSSNDGGSTWSGSVGAGCGDTPIVTAAPGVYYALASNYSTLYRSSSAGAVWSTVDISPIYAEYWSRTPLYATDSTSVYFAGTTHPDNRDIKVVAVSHDAGITFTPVATASSVSSGGFRAIGPWGDGICAVGTEGIIEMQAPGAPWRQVPIHVKKQSDFALNGLGFCDPQNGWAVGDNGKILRY